MAGMKKFFILFICVLGVNTVKAQTTLTLQECIRMALEQSKEIQIKQEEVKIAEHTKSEAFTAYLPKIDAMASYLHLSDKVYLLSHDKFLPIGTVMEDGSFGFRPDQVAGTTLPNGQWVPIDENGVPFDPKQNPEKIQWKDYTTIPRDELAVDARNTFIGAVSLIQPIYMGGKIRNINKMAEIGVDIAKQQEILEKTEIVYNVESAYWLVVSLISKVQTVEEYQKLLIKLESDISELEKEGMAVKSDVLKVRVKLNEVNMNLTKAQNGLSLSKMQLCQYIGMPLDTDINLVSESTESITLTYTDINNVWDNRMEIKSLEKLIELSDKKEKLAYSGLLPQIGFMANYMVSNPNFFNGFEKEFSGSWNVGVTMKVPIVHWGEHRKKVKSAKSESRISQLKLEDTKEKIELQYNQANFKISESDKKLLAANSNMEEAEENLKYARLAFEEGLVSVTEVLEAQTAWYQASSEKEDAEIESRLNKVYMKKVNGTLYTN